MEISRYVHLNPVRVGAIKQNSLREQLQYLGRYRWSSLGGYLKRGQGVPWVVCGAVLGYVGDPGRSIESSWRKNLAGAM